MRVLSFSYCFPNPSKPNWGVFVYQRLAALATLADVQVIAPVPVFPLWTRLHGPLPPLHDNLAGLVVHRPRYFYVPGVFKRLDGPLYARGLRGPLSRILAQWQPDLLDAHFIWPDGVAVSHLARQFDLPYAITLRGWLYEALRHPPILRQCVEALRNAQTIISVSRHLAETAAELGAPRQRIHVIANGVDLQQFTPRDKDEARQALGLPRDGRLLVSVAHLGPRKGHHETIQALAALPDDVRLAIVGGDPHPHGANRRHLLRLIHRLHLEDRVLLVGPQPYDRIPLFLSAADATVLASYREGCPNVVLESLACGRPVVASAVGAVPDLLEPDQNGLIVPVRQVPPLAEALQTAIDRDWPAESIRHCRAVQPWSTIAQRTLRALSVSG